MALALALALALAGCTGQLGSVDGGETGDVGSMSGDGTLPSPEPCVDAQCPGDGTCQLGECLPACTVGGPACPDGYFCDDASGLCQRSEIDPCPCAGDDFCSFGYCTSQPYDADCDPAYTLDTVCGARELCFDAGDVDGPERFQCWEMPACPPDGECPLGTVGAVCNDDLLPTKERVCLLGQCLDAGDCPEDYRCVDFGAVLGACSSGVIGDVCAQNTDCNSGNCVILVPGIPGFCG